MLSVTLLLIIPQKKGCRTHFTSGENKRKILEVVTSTAVKIVLKFGIPDMLFI